MTTTTVAPQGGLDFGGAAGVAFLHDRQGVDSDITIEWDFDNDGDFDETVEDITSYVLSAGSVTGRDYPSSVVGKASPGRLRLTLSNSDARFSPFNTSSPLAQDPYSLKVGRRIRVRTAESTPTDPQELAHDRFPRADGALGVAESGQTWVDQYNGWDISGNIAVPDTQAAAGNPGEVNISTVDLSAMDHYVQVRVGELDPSMIVGLVLRFEDISNYTAVYLTTVSAWVANYSGGVLGTSYSASVDTWDGVLLGARVQDDDIVVLLNGVEVINETAAVLGSSTGTKAGLYTVWDAGVLTPSITEFAAWTTYHERNEGILWTGYVESIDLAATVGERKAVTVTAVGELAKAALGTISAPSVILDWYKGAKTGHLVGNVLHRAGLLRPPYPLDEGEITTGPITVDDGDALSMARAFEETELGFLHETQEGPVGFDDRSARVGTTAAVAFSDHAGAQFQYRSVTPLSRRKEIVNRVTAGVAHRAPALPTFTTRTANTASGVTNNVAVQMPSSVISDDLVVVFISSTVANASVGWKRPTGWVEHRGLASDINLKVYSKILDGTEASATVTFYTDSTASGGAWIAHIAHISGYWFKAYDNGVVFSEPNRGANPRSLVVPWGRAPSLFLAVYSGLTSSSGGSIGTVTYPNRYTYGAASSLNGSVNGFDVGQAVAYRRGSTYAEDPTTFSGPSGYLIEESAIFAVRGYNGPHSNATLDQPQTTGGDGIFVTVEDQDSQREHRMVRSYPTPSNLFWSETSAEAYADAIIDAYADERPLVSISFPATVSGHYRNQAITRRVSDKIRLVATGDSGLGIDDDYVIESISHEWSDAAKQWQTTWEMSPA